MKSLVRNLFGSIPPIARLMNDRSELYELKERMVYPPGHFYSPLPDLNEVGERQKSIFDTSQTIEDVDLKRDEQISLLHEFKQRASEFPFPNQKSDEFRYFLENNAYSYNDAFSYWSMLLKFQPKRVIEIGLGMSTCLLLDTQQKFLNSRAECTLIDPYPNRFKSLCGEDMAGATLLSEKLQDVSPSLFETLGPNDILFIDSSHVAKTGSDVNCYMFDILPRLKSGVVVHIHDILYPFEYPEEWVFKGIAWNEIYLVRAMLQANTDYEIVFWNHFLATVASQEYADVYPQYRKDPGGSLWIRKR